MEYLHHHLKVTSVAEVVVAKVGEAVVMDVAAVLATALVVFCIKGSHFPWKIRRSYGRRTDEQTPY